MEPCEYFVVHRQPEPFIGQLEVPTQELERLHFVVKFDPLDGIEPSAPSFISERLARSDDVLLFRCQVLKPLEVAVLVEAETTLADQLAAAAREAERLRADAVMSVKAQTEADTQRRLESEISRVRAETRQTLPVSDVSMKSQVT